MANPYSITINSISTDGTNYFVTATVFDGVHNLPSITPVFPVGTSPADINTYLQNIATNQPTLPGNIAALVNTTLAGQ